MNANLKFKFVEQKAKQHNIVYFDISPKQKNMALHQVPDIFTYKEKDYRFQPYLLNPYFVKYPNLLAPIVL